MVRISSSRIDLENARIDRAVLKDYGETVVGGAGGAASSSSYAVDIANGNVFHVVLTANCTLSFSNPTTSGTACTVTLYLQQDNLGSRTVTWPSSVVWANGFTPVLTATPNYTDILSFTTIDGGSTWLGFI